MTPAARQAGIEDRLIHAIYAYHSARWSRAPREVLAALRQHTLGLAQRAGNLSAAASSQRGNLPRRKRPK